MAETLRKYKGSLTLGKLEIALEAHEQLFGELTKVEAKGGFTVATFSDDDGYPALDALALMPMIGDSAPSAPDAADHMFDGAATVLSTVLKISVFRTS